MEHFAPRQQKHLQGYLKRRDQGLLLFLRWFIFFLKAVITMKGICLRIARYGFDASRKIHC